MENEKVDILEAKDVFAQKIQEFREACYFLTGYRIDVVQDQYSIS